MAQRITSYLVERGAVTPDDADVQVYGLQVILSTAINLFAAILLSLLLGQVAFGLSFLIAFMLIRRFTGGYHAHSYLGCFLSLQAILLAGFALRSLYGGIWSVWIASAIAALSLLLVFLLAPIDHENKPSTPASRKKFRMLSRALSAAMAACTFGGLWVQRYEPYALGILMALFTTGVMLAVAKIRKKGGAVS